MTAGMSLLILMEKACMMWACMHDNGGVQHGHAWHGQAWQDVLCLLTRLAMYFLLTGLKYPEYISRIRKTATTMIRQ